MHYTYVIQSRASGKWYTGIAVDLRKRLREHNAGESRSTKGRGPFELVYYEACLDRHDAAMREKYLKSGPGKRYLRNRLQRFLSLTGQVPLEKSRSKRLKPRLPAERSLTGQVRTRPVRGKPPRATASSNRGFIALVSAIIISAVLLILVTAASFSGFFGRFNILDSESKERSGFLAEACVNTAILKLSQDVNYDPTLEEKTKNVGDEHCDIVSVLPVGVSWPKTIRTQASSSNAFTNLKIEVNDLAGDIVIISWEEIPGP